LVGLFSGKVLSARCFVFSRDPILRNGRGAHVVLKLMPKLPIDHPEYFWSRAEEARAMSEAMTDAETRRMILSVAQTYENLAKRSEARPSPMGGLQRTSVGSADTSNCRLSYLKHLTRLCRDSNQSVRDREFRRKWFSARPGRSPENF
jgi:hypothetical protein